PPETGLPFPKGGGTNCLTGSLGAEVAFCRTAPSDGVSCLVASTLGGGSSASARGDFGAGGCTGGGVKAAGWGFVGGGAGGRVWLRWRRSGRRLQCDQIRRGNVCGNRLRTIRLQNELLLR